MPEIEVRPARQEDREAVLAFCAKTWEWGDYIEHVWDEWLHDPQGGMYVAVADGRPVGVSHYRLLTPTEVWLEGMRVDPAYRKQGLSAILNNTMMAEAMNRGATHARLITESTNGAAIALIERGLFRLVGAFARYRATPLTANDAKKYGPDMPRLATEADVDDIVDYLNVSNNFPVTGGLYYLDFTAYAVTGEVIEAKVAAQQVYILRRWDRLDGLVIAEPGSSHYGSELSIGYIDGTTESISLLAYTLRRQAMEMELERIVAYVPDLIMVRDAFAGAEYEWDGKLFYTYERGLT